jgi:hypothetical protein
MSTIFSLSMHYISKKLSSIFKFIFFEFVAVGRLHKESTCTAKNMLKNLIRPIKGAVIRRYRKFHKEDVSGRTHSPCQ